MVKTPAVFCDIPLPAAILETTASKSPPGETSIGQTDCPAAVVLAGWLYGTPAFVSAERNALLIMSARMGAARVAAAAVRATVKATNHKTVACIFGAQITVTRVANNGHIYDTMR